MNKQMSNTPDSSDKSIQNKQQLSNARVYINKKDYSNAIQLLINLCAENPDLAEAFYLLGICYINEERYFDAASYLSQAIELLPDIAENHSMLALCYSNMGKQEVAIQQYQKALELDENNIAALSGLGHMYYRQGNLKMAKQLYCKAVEKKPSLPENQIKLALIYSEMGNMNTAVKHAKKAIHLSPKCANTIGIVGRVYLAGGEIKEAVKYFRKALDVDPANGVAYYDLVSLEKIRDKDNPLLKKMENNLKKGMPSFNRVAMHFALGKAYNDCKQWDKAIQNFDKGNRLILTSYDRKQEEKFVKGVKKIFTPAFFTKYKGIGNSSMLPVFVVGMPRSGSTLIDQVISSHSNVHSVGESKALSSVVLSLIEKNNYQEFPECMKTISSDFIQTIANQYIEIITEDSGEVARIVNKMLFNFYYLGLIAIMYPNAKIIHSMRNPLDTCLSIYFTNFVSNGTEDEWGSSLENIGFYYRQYHAVMKHWCEVLPIDILDIQYEDTVENFEEQARKIIDFCDLPWEPQCLEFYKSKRSVHTASVSQVRQPIYKSSVSRWPPYAKYLGPLVEQLGDIVKDDYEQLRELGCDFKVKKGLLSKLFK